MTLFQRPNLTSFVLFKFQIKIRIKFLNNNSITFEIIFYLIIFNSKFFPFNKKHKIAVFTALITLI
jgi:hypothetical protein